MLVAVRGGEGGLMQFGVWRIKSAMYRVVFWKVL
jgi:hypothetical protein